MSRSYRLRRPTGVRQMLVALAVATSLATVPAATAAGPEEGQLQERLIKSEESPVQVLLKGDSTYQVSLGGDRFSRKLQQRSTLVVRGHVFDPLTEPGPQVEGFSIAAPQGFGLYIVQFHIQALPQLQEALETRYGAVVYRPIHHHALLIGIEADEVAKLAGDAFVRWTGPYHPIYKLQPGLEEAGIITGLGTVSYRLLAVQRSLTEDAAREIASIGGEVSVSSPKAGVIQAWLSYDQLLEMAKSPRIAWIELNSETTDDLEDVRELGGANHIELVEGYSGQGVRVEAFDDGLRATHQDFQLHPPQFHPSNNPSDFDHGTPVYAIVYGTGLGDPTARGLLPDAEAPLFASRFTALSEYGGLQDRHSHTAETVDPAGPYRAVVQTSSWGHTQVTNYTSVSVESDQIVFDLDFLVLQSQSNQGTRNSRPEAWAKNVVGVGGVANGGDDTNRANDTWGSASIGPAEDGRIQPDISQQYGGIHAADNVGDAAYNNFGGTSGATPAAAAQFGLVFQMWADGVFDGGPGKNRDVFDSRPHATTARALVYNTAFQYPFSGESHNLTRVHQGWGFPDLKSLYEVARANLWTLPILIDESAVIAPLETHVHTLNVAGTEPLKVTMVYADPPGTPGVLPHRVNDLSLRVTSPTGTVYWGNNGLKAGNWSTPGGVSNTVDTVENVFIENPAAGSWTIEVLADEIIQDGHVETPATDADYALVATGGSAGPNLPPAAPTGLAATAGDGSVGLDWADNTEPDLSSYNVKRSTSAGGPHTQIASVASSDYADDTASNGTTYHYVVTAVDSAGNESGISNAASATPLDQPPATPVALSAGAGDGLVNLDWADNGEGDLAGYRVKRSTSAGGPYTTIASPVASAHLDVGLTNGTTYYYVVSAVDTGAKESGNSAEASATPQPAPACAVDDSFEGGIGGWVNSTGSTCATGAFVLGTPTQQTSTVVTQVGGDHTTGTGNAVFTATNTAAGNNDVDGGVCILDSPIWNVGPASELSIWYFHGQRDNGDDPAGDFFRIEVSTDGGSSYTPVVAIGDVTTVAVWSHATAPIPAGSSVRLRVQASDGSIGDIIEGGIDDVSICSTAAPDTTLTVNTAGQGTVALDPPGGAYDTGTVVTLTAAPAAGWRFDGWSGDLAGTQNPTTITMSANRSVTATFSEIPAQQFTLGVTTVGQGSVGLSPAGGIYDAGTVVTLTATPAAGWQFDGWSGALTGAQKPTTITMDTNKSVTATFSLISTTEILLEENPFGGDKIEVNEGQTGAQAFTHGSASDPTYSITKVVLYLSRDQAAPDGDLSVSIGTAVNSGTLAGSLVTITPQEVTDTSAASTFVAFDVTFSSPVGPLSAGTTYFLNLENEAPNGQKYYLEFDPDNQYPGGNYWKGGSDEGKDARFQIWGK